MTDGNDADTSWHIVCDFDGTVSVEDVTDCLLDRFAAPEWRDIETQWRDGLIGSRECMGRQIDLLRVAPAWLDAFLAGIWIDPGFPRFVEYCRRFGVPLLIVSDGLDRVIQRILTRVGLNYLPIVANEFVFESLDRWKLEFPNARGECNATNATCKCLVADDFLRQASRLLLIGNGISDFCIARKADFIFAKDDLAEYCRQTGIPHVAVSDFNEIRLLLPSLLKGRFLPSRSVVGSTQQTVEYS